METYVSLLRAVNVGGSGKLPMAELRILAEEIGLTEVRTYIQSGNLIFTSADKPAAVKVSLEACLERYFGKPVGIVVRTADEMQQTLRENPFPDAAPNKVGVLFLDHAPTVEVVEKAKGQSDEEIEVGPRVIYIHYPSGMGKSKLRLSEMAHGTVRNINTVAKLVELSSKA